MRDGRYVKAIPLYGSGGFGLLINDADPEGDTLSAIIVGYPSKGDLHANADGSFTYRWNGGNNGRDTFTYKANDGQLDSNNVATVTIEVHSTNQATVTVEVNKSYQLRVNLTGQGSRQQHRLSGQL